MGARGPAPTPTEILKARGSRRAQERAGEVQFERGRPTCPAWLGKEAKAEWNRQVKQLAAAGILQKVDRALLAAWCEAWGEFAGITCAIGERLRQDPVLGYSVIISNGLMNAKNKAVERLLRLAQQFGFSPAARVRIRAAGDEDDGGAETLRYFSGAAL